ncbi:uncharacterized protein [Amphiura filiformis]|uniref:uncharacterized protein n=1 Tax=Amphiura filiformis TaxID=82378 RepID=UPI003B217D22
MELPALHKYTSNVYVAVDKVDKIARKRRATEDILYANLTRSDIDDTNSFTIGDNKTYGGYTNHVLIGGEDYMVMIQYASCTPVEECSTTRWSRPTTFTAPKLTKQLKGSSSSSVITIVIIIIFVVILFMIVVVVIVLKRRQKSPSQTSPTSNETYDEIDPQIAQQSAIQNETGYEVNLAMEGIQTPKQYEGDELDYEDVKTKRESDYQGLNTGDMETEHDYQGLGETEKKKESNYQGLNKANMDEEHDYQGLGQKSDTNRKTSSPYVNVP